MRTCVTVQLKEVRHRRALAMRWSGLMPGEAHHLFPGSGLLPIPVRFLALVVTTLPDIGSFDAMADLHIGTNMHPSAGMTNEVLSGTVLGIHADLQL